MPVPETYRKRPYAAKCFRAIVEYARDHNRFYHAWIKDIEAVSVIDRRTFLDHNDAILGGFPVTARTSGSTGVPVRISQSAERIRMDLQDDIRFANWLGGQLPCSRILHPTSDPAPDWLLDVQAPLDEQIDFIFKRYREAGAIALTTYPTNAELLALEITRREIDMSFMVRVGVFAEAFTPHQRATVQRAFPAASVWSTYSAMEFGLIAGQCPYEPDFHHIMAHKLGLEILDEGGEPCEPGQIGRVVITDYFNRRSPLIRYEIGDLAARRPCPCGRIDLPALCHIVGKTRGTLLHRDGRRVIFTELSVALRDLPGMRQYQVVQEDLEVCLVKVVAQERLDEDIRSAFASHFGYVPDELRIEYLDAIAREPSGKFHASICRI